MVEDDGYVGRVITLPYERYLIGGFLGSGGMGTVYSGVQESTQRKVAIKCIGNVDSLERFELEAGNTVKAREPRCRNIVKVYDAGIDDVGGFSWMAMEKVDGVDLHEMLRVIGGMLEFDMVYALNEQVIGALKNAHRNHIIHRDLKAPNILVDSVDNVVKLSDFGLAYSQRDSMELTKVNIERIGTPHWMSKFQIKPYMMDIDECNVMREGFKQYYVRWGKKLNVVKSGGNLQVRYTGPEIDYSVVGCQLLYCLMRGFNPFTLGSSGDPLEIMNRVSLATPKDVSLTSRLYSMNGDCTVRSMRGDALRQVQRIISKSVSNDIFEVYHSGDELLGDLRKAFKMQYGGRYRLDSEQCVVRMFCMLDRKIDEKYDFFMKGGMARIFSDGFSQCDIGSLKDDISLLFKRMKDAGKVRRLMQTLESRIDDVIVGAEDDADKSRDKYQFYYDITDSIKARMGVDEFERRRYGLSEILKRLK